HDRCGRARPVPDPTKVVFDTLGAFAITQQFESSNGNITTINVDGSNRTELTSGFTDSNPESNGQAAIIVFQRDVGFFRPPPPEFSRRSFVDGGGATGIFAIAP